MASALREFKDIAEEPSLEKRQMMVQVWWRRWVEDLTNQQVISTNEMLLAKDATGFREYVRRRLFTEVGLCLADHSGAALLLLDRPEIGEERVSVRVRILRTEPK